MSRLCIRPTSITSSLASCCDEATHGAGGNVVLGAPLQWLTGKPLYLPAGYGLAVPPFQFSQPAPLASETGLHGPLLALPVRA